MKKIENIKADVNNILSQIVLSYNNYNGRLDIESETVTDYLDIQFKILGEMISYRMNDAEMADLYYYIIEVACKSIISNPEQGNLFRGEVLKTLFSHLPKEHPIRSNGELFKRICDFLYSPENPQIYGIEDWIVEFTPCMKDPDLRAYYIERENGAKFLMGDFPIAWVENKSLSYEEPSGLFCDSLLHFINCEPIEINPHCDVAYRYDKRQASEIDLSDVISSSRTLSLEDYFEEWIGGNNDICQFSYTGVRNHLIKICERLSPEKRRKVSDTLKEVCKRKIEYYSSNEHSKLKEMEEFYREMALPVIEAYTQPVFSKDELEDLARMGITPEDALSILRLG